MSTATVQPADHPTYLGAAWEYAKRGFKVLPLQGIRNRKYTCQERRDKNGKGACGTLGKHPRFRNWPERATTDATEIEKWFSPASTRPVPPSQFLGPTRPEASRQCRSSCSLPIIQSKYSVALECFSLPRTGL
jgi:hypothetical protein